MTNIPKIYYWHNTDDMLPPRDEHCHTYSIDVLARYSMTSEIMSANYSYEEGKWYNYEGDEIPEPANWMEIPEVGTVLYVKNKRWADE